MSAGGNRVPVRGGVRTRHLVLAGAFLFLAGLRVADGAPWWAAVFAAVAAGYLWLSVRSPRSGTARRPVGGETPTPDGIIASVRGHTRSARLWLVLSLLTAGGGAVLLTSAPALALVLGILSVVALRLVWRSRRSVTLLRRLPGPPTVG